MNDDGFNKSIYEIAFFIIVAMVLSSTIYLITPAVKLDDKELSISSMMKTRIDDLDVIMTEKSKDLICDYDDVLMNVSAYCPCELCCAPWDDGITATGTNAYTRGVAVDPKYIPYGTKLYVEGYGEVVADDCGGSIKMDRLDLRFNTHQEALNWGRKKMIVRIYKDNK